MTYSKTKYLINRLRFLEQSGQTPWIHIQWKGNSGRTDLIERLRNIGASIVSARKRFSNKKIDAVALIKASRGQMLVIDGYDFISYESKLAVRDHLKAGGRLVTLYKSSRSLNTGGSGFEDGSISLTLMRMKSGYIEEWLNSDQISSYQAMQRLGMDSFVGNGNEIIITAHLVSLKQKRRGTSRWPLKYNLIDLVNDKVSIDEFRDELNSNKLVTRLTRKLTLREEPFTSYDIRKAKVLLSHMDLEQLDEWGIRTLIQMLVDEHYGTMIYF
ncbi:hypothetical protein [Vibrio owensii]|uniref:hypothetical protein n=1 Tax=Vibrio owensii TaxID=696485 RepID=UPI003CC6C1C8